jgi:hypothetical protein
MQISLKNTVFAVLLITLVSLGSLPAQEKPGRLVADLPLFKALAGARVETGTLVPRIDGPPLEGSAKSFGLPALGGLWFQIDGTAEFGPAKWGYRWMYRFREQGDKNVVYALYIDTMGQQLQFQGPYDEAANKIELLAKLPDGGTSRAILILNADGTLTVDNVNADPQGKDAIKYAATNRSAP